MLGIVGNLLSGLNILWRRALFFQLSFRFDIIVRATIDRLHQVAYRRSPRRHLLRHRRHRRRWRHRRRTSSARRRTAQARPSS